MWGNVQNFAITNMWRNTLLVVVINRNCFHNHHCHHRKQRRQHQYIHFLLFLVCQLCLHHSALSRVVKKTNVTEETQERLSIHICASLINTKAGADVRVKVDKKSILFIPLSSGSPTDLLYTRSSGWEPHQATPGQNVLHLWEVSQSKLSSTSVYFLEHLGNFCNSAATLLQNRQGQGEH